MVVVCPSQPVKMMRYRGSDDDVVGFGHFCEVRKVKEGPADEIPRAAAEPSDEELDAYAAKQLAKKVCAGCAGCRLSQY